MATASEIATVRDNLNDTVEPYRVDDAEINALVDELGVDAASARLWRRRAAELSSLVDVSEGGASRKLSQAFTQAREMAALYGAMGGTSAAASRPRLHRITRPGPLG